MKLISKKIYLLLLTFYNISVYSQVADLEITTDLDFKEVNFLEQGTFTVTVINHGPQAAGIDSGSGFPNLISLTPQKLEANGFISMSITRNPNIEQNCRFGLAIAELNDPDDPVRFLHFISYPKIEPSEEITCHGIYGIGFEQGVRDLYWESFLLNSETDPNSSNNVAEFSFGIKPQVIPTLNLWSFIVLFILLLVIAKLNMQSKTKTNN